MKNTQNSSHSAASRISPIFLDKSLNDQFFLNSGALPLSGFQNAIRWIITLRSLPTWQFGKQRNWGKERYSAKQGMCSYCGRWVHGVTVFSGVFWWLIPYYFMMDSHMGGSYPKRRPCHCLMINFLTDPSHLRWVI